MVLVKIWSLQLISLYQFFPPHATMLHRIIRGMYLYYNKNGVSCANGKVYHNSITHK